MPEATISAAGMRIVKLLVGNPPQAVTSLIRATGVTRTAVTEQLNELVAAGFVNRAAQKLAGRGRPRHLYSATNAALLLLFSGKQQKVVPALWQAIDEVGGADLTKKIVRRVGRTLAEYYSSRINVKSPKERLQRFIELMREEGGLLDVSHKSGRLQVYKRTCPFISMVDEKRTVCTLDLELMTTVVGKPIRRTACRFEGAPCCVIEIAPDG
jgi:predicted ArsR family transcriptional regulator